MKAIQSVLGVGCLLAIAVAGCGGGGSSSSSTGNSAYAGSYSGSYTASNGDAGSVNFTVDANGGISGSMSTTPEGQGGSLGGSVGSTGVASISGANITVSGQLENSSPDILTGVLIDPGTGNTYTLTFSVSE